MDSASFCLTCSKKSVCKEICPELEKVLPKPQGGNNGRKMKFYAPSIIEDIANRRAFEIRYGNRYFHKTRPEN